MKFLRKRLRKLRRVVAEPITYTQSEHYSRTIFGFWVYLLTDCVMFGALFASYLVLRGGTYGGPKPQDLFELWHAFGVTVLLLTASLFAGLARVQAFRSQKLGAMLQFAICSVLGIWFLASTYFEGAHIFERGYSWQTSAFLSAFFTVIWTHAFHVLAGILWTLVMIWQLWRRGITVHTFRRLSILTMFWQFLSILWVFTFTIIYLMGIGGL